MACLPKSVTSIIKGSKREWLDNLLLRILFTERFSHNVKYSQTCVQRPPLGLKKSGHCLEVKAKVVIIHSLFL